MSDFDRAELSALLDGELEPARAREVEALVAADPSLLAAFEQLEQVDQRLKALAQTACFAPRISWPTMRAIPAFPWLAACLAVLVTAWTLSKVASGMSAALSINASVFVLFVVCLMSLARYDERTRVPRVAKGC